MFPITPELIKAMNADKYRDSEEFRAAKALKSIQKPKKRFARGPWSFRQILRRIVFTAVKR